MKLTSKEAKVLLEKGRLNVNDKWIQYCINVGNIAGKIANALNQKSIDVNIDKTIT